MSNNPKDILASSQKKPLLSIIPQAAMIACARGLMDGANKYGRYNWRDNDIALSTYISAMMRHLVALADGEDCAPDSKLHHLAHVMAGAAIVLDAIEYKVLVDDRPGMQEDEGAKDGDTWDRPPLKLHGVDETGEELPWAEANQDIDPRFYKRHVKPAAPSHPDIKPGFDFPKFPTHGEIYLPLGTSQRWRYEGNGQWVNLSAFTEKGQPKLADGGQPIGKYESIAITS